ncbi:hypothetical protein [Mycetocola zhujimingii]|uniref:Uncharacterized protein n=1 Tax=Mycetocola zhujimingii TaxID=2079792 RepID=A0A2U1THM5_9MICO|nr:hypothetical protein [Mycetocola zhujimingii]PWC08391.1 hypothetical protein DF223_03400 [Mycetocola zhujimingii]
MRADAATFFVAGFFFGTVGVASAGAGVPLSSNALVPPEGGGVCDSDAEVDAGASTEALSFEALSFEALSFANDGSTADAVAVVFAMLRPGVVAGFFFCGVFAGSLPTAAPVPAAGASVCFLAAVDRVVFFAVVGVDAEVGTAIAEEASEPSVTGEPAGADVPALALGARGVLGFVVRGAAFFTAGRASSG